MFEDGDLFACRNKHKQKETWLYSCPTLKRLIECFDKAVKQSDFTRKKMNTRHYLFDILHVYAQVIGL